MESLPNELFLKSSVLSSQISSRNMLKSEANSAKVGQGRPSRREERYDLLPYLVRKIRHLNSWYSRYHLFQSVLIEFVIKHGFWRQYAKRLQNRFIEKSAFRALFYYCTISTVTVSSHAWKIKRFFKVIWWSLFCKKQRHQGSEFF